MMRRLIGKRKPHKRPGTSARQERRKSARERLGESIAAVLTDDGYTVEKRNVILTRRRAEYATLGRSLGIMESVDA